MDGVMVDLESMSTAANAAIVSIGAVRFMNYKITSEFYVNVDVLSCKKVGLDINQSTIDWWKKQDPEAIKALMVDQVSIHEALHRFREWFGPQSMPVWGNGAAFDNVVIEHAYQAIGEHRPWKYWDDRCYRTFAAVFGFPRMPKNGPGVKHNALHDARYQAEQLLKFFEE